MDSQAGGAKAFDYASVSIQLLRITGHARNLERPCQHGISGGDHERTGQFREVASHSILKHEVDSSRCPCC